MWHNDPRMKKKISFAVALLLALASVGALAQAVEAPKYGGTLTAFVQSTAADPNSPDILTGAFNSTEYLSPIQERLLYGDFETYGPRGSGEYAFQVFQVVPEEYMTGHLLTGYETTKEKITMHVREGVYWCPNEAQSAWMEKRELVAQDIVNDVEHFMTVPRGASVKSMIKSITAPDEHTVVIEFTEFNTQLMYLLGYEDRSLIAPQEMLDKGDDQWENQVGTGPFLFGEYERGSYMLYEKNPDWWKKTVIDGVTYDVPFVDELVYPIIPDESTQVSALRSGQIDVMQRVPPSEINALRETCPDLNIAVSGGSQGWGLAFNTLNAPFDNPEVRRALSIATDYAQFTKLWDVGSGEAVYPWWPLFRDFPGIYVSKENLPEDVGMLYDYNPELAASMLRAAGVEEGFTLTIVTDSATDNINRASLLKDQWAKVGVNVVIDSYDNVTFDTIRKEKKFDHAIMTLFGAANTQDEMYNRGYSTNWANWSGWANPEFDALMDQVLQETDLEKTNDLLRQAGILMMRDGAYMPLETIPEAIAWWPWVRNFYGEKCIGDNEIAQVLATAWIDQDMKREMGF